MKGGGDWGEGAGGGVAEEAEAVGKEAAVCDGLL
jgi:hypothetical protein